MRYTIDSENAVSIFNDGDGIPFWYQPTYPNGDTFDSYEEAEIWAKLAIAAYDENEPFAPDGKNLPGDLKPTKEQMEALEKRHLR